ncbi:MAG: iron ABC transporter permease, partial [Deltaproteobacteria bacterium]|nr:iron ABC transporter permease [Deltaproteobacteria bacterium]
MTAKTENLAQYLSLNRRRRILALAMAAITIVLGAADLLIGSSGLSAAGVWEALAAGPKAGNSGAYIIWALRLPMTLTCVFVGASLSLAGLQIQNITNNMLASPYTLGITAGASFGAAIAVTTGLTVLGRLWLGTVFLALILALSISLVIYQLGRLRGLSPGTLILSGIIMNFFFQALQQYLQYRASPEIAQIIAGWTFGNLARSTWICVSVNAFLLAAGAAILSRWAWRLTALTIGEERALSLGVNVARLRLQVFLLSAFMVAGAVGFIGTVAFVGLVAPHCAKLIMGE